MSHRTKFFFLNVLLFLGGFISVAMAQPKPLLEYHLDETGSLCVSVGADMLPLTLLDVNGVPADLHSADASGISGRISDRAFDNTAATAMGGAGTGGVALVPTNIVSVGAFSSFTLQCWFNARTPLSQAARLFDAGNYVVFAGRKPGVLWLCANRLSTGTRPAYAQTNEWIFFAVSYDGTRVSNNVVFYRGTKDSPVVQIEGGTLNAGLVTNSHAIGLGNLSYANVRPFLGRMDDVRIFGTGSGDTGVLTQPQLESIRQGDAGHFQPEQIASRKNGAFEPANILSSAPVINNPQYTGKGFALDVQTVSGVHYSVLWSGDLLKWQTLTNFVGDGNVITVRDAVGRQHAFYRVMAQ